MQTPNLAKIWQSLGHRAKRRSIPGKRPENLLAQALNLPPTTTYAELILQPGELVKVNITRIVTKAELKNLEKIFNKNLVCKIVEKPESYYIIDGDSHTTPFNDAD
jgi:hypothetical protein